MIDRLSILNAVRKALEPLKSVVALWEGGSAAWDRADDMSDIDLQVAADADAIDLVFDTVASALPPVELVYRLPEPTWHGHAQTFYRFENAPPSLLLDLVVMKQEAPPRLNERERHGEPCVLFDKAGWIQVTSLDAAEHASMLRDRVQSLAVRFELFQHMVEKALARGNEVEAVAFYQQLTWRPLIEMLRIRHAPARFDLGPRYIPHDLPAAAAARVQHLAYVADRSDLAAKHTEAGAWFRALAATPLPTDTWPWQADESDTP